ncbi:MAG: YdeI/OmpD-associated family protein [Chloroflexota bacterium]
MTAGTGPGGLPVIAFVSAADWDAWLAEHQADQAGLWLKIAKKGSGLATVSYAEALDVALCRGWIDGQKEKLDDQCWLQRFTPRRAGSKWSAINRARAIALTERGRMQPAGIRQIDQARADGRWDVAYAGSKSSTVPDDLQRALDRDEAARAFFATLDSRNRYAILYRVQDTKTPEARARRVEKYVAMLSEGKKIHG